MKNLDVHTAVVAGLLIGIGAVQVYMSRRMAKEQ
jgi:hypothetical protein